MTKRNHNAPSKVRRRTKIVSTIPPPQRYIRGYPYSDLDVGQSFWAPIPATQAANQAQYYRRKLGYAFSVRTEANRDGVPGARVWRTA
jgi:hypothetical protein